jgi:hypothetical protein
MRKELLAMRSQLETDSSIRPIDPDVLLAYAKNISSTTIPPTFRPPAPKLGKAEKSEEADADVQMTNGETPYSPSHVDREPPPIPDAAEKLSRDILPEQKQFLEDVSHLAFLPWPHDDVIRAGALSTIQRMIYDKIDPTTILTQGEQEEAARKAEEEKAREKAEAEERRKARAAEASTGAGVSGRPKQPAAEEFAGFGLYNPDEADMDEDED